MIFYISSKKEGNVLHYNKLQDLVFILFKWQKTQVCGLLLVKYKVIIKQKEKCTVAHK